MLDVLTSYDPSYGWGIGALMAYFGTLFAIAILPGLIIYVLAAIFLMSLFEKAGVEGKWRAWVPVYNAMVFFKLGDMSPWLVLIFGVGGAILVVIWVGSLALMALAVFAIMAAVRISMKAKGDAAWVALYAGVPGIGSLIWLGIMAYTPTPWRNDLPAPGWAGGFLADKTQWNGVPDGIGGQAAPAYASAAGYPYGYAPPQAQVPPQTYGQQYGAPPQATPPAPQTGAPETGAPPVPPQRPDAP